MIRAAEEKAEPFLQPLVFSIRSDEAGRCICRSQDGRVGGIFANRYRALREIDELVSISGRAAIIVIQPESKS